jgi:murein DD-endopeptidase MepM/ murein hydrolase activator NlpD
LHWADGRTKRYGRSRKRGNHLDQQQHHTGKQTGHTSDEDILLSQHTAEIPVVQMMDGRLPAPFVPDFAWKPGMNDYPVALIPSSSTLRRKGTLSAGEWDDVPLLEDIERHRLPVRYIPHALAVVAVVAVVMSNSLWWNRGEKSPDNPVETPAAVVDSGDADSTDAPSLLDRVQQPGQGGNVPSATPTTEVEKDATRPAAAATSEVAPTATPTTTTTPPASSSDGAPVERIPGAGTFERRTFDGERLIDIAGVYGLSVTTLAWANDIDDPTALVGEGVMLTIPPVDGVLHTVQAGDTLESIAAAYGSDPETIIGFEPNGVASSADLYPGQSIMVPWGVVRDWGKLREYTVQEGDHLWTIADYFGVTPQTIAFANTLPRPEMIGVGQELVIPPGDGALIIVEAGDHVEAIAAEFGVDPQAIRDYEFNNLGGDRVLQEGQYLLVPGAALPDLESAEPSALDANTVAGEGAFNPASGVFIWPTSGTISQEFHGGHSGIDIANQEWTPVNAADGGIVIFAGWNDYGLGYAVGIDHGNGRQTWYGHLIGEPFVEVGQTVWQGGYLGGMGSTGKSTGPHLHFVVMENGVYQNPLNYLQ